jgi:DNA polymerase-1
MPIATVAEYSEIDARMTLELAEELAPRCTKDAELWQTEVRFMKCLYDMECRGLMIDVPSTEALKHELVHTAVEVGAQMASKGIRNIGSDREVRNYLFYKLKLPILKHTGAKGQPSIAQEVLEQLAEENEDARAILRWNHATKALSSWIEPFLQQRDEFDRLHPSFDVAGTRSGRISCRNPNLQAVPIEDKSGRLEYGGLRRCFAAPSGYRLVAFDYKQADLRVATAYAKENRMAHVLLNSDPYSAMAVEIWGSVDKRTRQLAKRISLATINAVGVDTLAASTGLTREQAQDTLRRHRHTFPAFVNAGKYCERWAKRHGSIPLWTGRVLYLADYDEPHKAFSRLVQGGVAEMVKRAMLDVERALAPFRSRMLLQIHDSILVEMNTAEEAVLTPLIIRYMKEALPEEVRNRTDPPIVMGVDAGDW